MVSFGAFELAKIILWVTSWRMDVDFKGFLHIYGGSFYYMFRNLLSYNSFLKVVHQVVFLKLAYLYQRLLKEESSFW